MIRQKILICLTFILVTLLVVVVNSNIKSNEAEAQTCVTIWQKGMMCGLYWMSQNTVRINVRCHGNQVNIGCPVGYSQENFGYIETDGGSREFKACFKT